ncbi:hypothetical protein [Halobacteriovorax sp. ZH4_bin.1]|uniref:hypothetical protein n=1 Tax=unclassified Halobacteriovorax TaxID=2639665 RepID=UPI00371C1087
METIVIVIIIIIMLNIIAHILFPKASESKARAVKTTLESTKDSKYSEEELNKLSEIQRIKDKVVLLKETAQKQELDKKVFKLFNKLNFFIKEDQSDDKKDLYLEGIIKLSYNWKKNLDVLYKDQTILFRLGKEKYFDDTEYTDLNLILNEELVFTLTLCRSRTYDVFVGYEDWSILKIDSYIPGEWQDLINEIYDEMIKVEQKREKSRKLDLTETNELKKKFGIK